MEKESDRIEKIRDALYRKFHFQPEIGFILGSGLGDLAEKAGGEKISFREIAGMPVSTAPGHNGQFVFCRLGGKNVLIMQGRVHFYEGYSMSEVVRPVRAMRALGADKLILTNAAGAVNETFSPGDLAVISDHILSFVPSPLIGENVESLGTRFPDMSAVYSERLRKIAQSCAAVMNIPLKSGVYLQTSGPNYETPAEIRMFKALGADMVGMSTACEAAAAKHAGMEVFGISVITNMAAGLAKTELSHSEVQENANKASKNFQSLICSLLELM